MQKDIHKQEKPDALFSIEIVIKFSLILAIIALGLILLYVLYPERRDTFNFIVSVLATSAGISSAFYFAKTTKQNLDFRKSDREFTLYQKKVDRSLEYIARWNDLTKLYLTEDTLNLIKTLDDARHEDRGKLTSNSFKEKDDLRQSVLALLNFIESLSIAIQKEIIDEDIVKDYYCNIVVRYYSLFSSWINQLKDTRKDKGNSETPHRYYASFYYLHKRWNNSTKKVG